jgi:DNA-binding NtrC family response regulator
MSNILVIDDEKSIRKALSEILINEGYKVDEAVDGLEGYNLIKTKKYNCVLCDIKMPRLDGMEMLDKLLVEKIDVPVIMISGHGTLDNAVEAVKKGAFDFVSKPPDLNRLLITIRNAIEK